MSDGPLVIGIDIGTSGVRAAALSVARKHQTHSPIVIRTVSRTFPADETSWRSPAVWWQTTLTVLDELCASLPAGNVKAMAVDGTSGTVLPIDAAGNPLDTPLMYNDTVSDAEIIERIADHMPQNSAAGGASSGLAKALHFLTVAPARIVHQADWIAGCLMGHHGFSDANNALKSGYDPISRCWPDWIENTGMNRQWLPKVSLPGDTWLCVNEALRQRFALHPDCHLVAGTTDGCAAFLATGAQQPGDAVTSLGSTITLKMLSDKPLFDPAIGLYSHRIGDTWLAGGASNSGGRVLLKYFDKTTLAALSESLDIYSPTGLNYYPLLEPGERFPINDPELNPRLSPRPDDDARFLQGMLEGMTHIEASGYQRLKAAGAPAMRSIRTVGGGASNQAWQHMRVAALGVPAQKCLSEDAAVGVASLALRKFQQPQ